MNRCRRAELPQKSELLPSYAPALFLTRCKKIPAVPAARHGVPAAELPSGCVPPIKKEKFYTDGSRGFILETGRGDVYSKT